MEKEDRIQEQFRRFDTNHPEIYQEFCQIARTLLCHGRSHYGSKAILEIIRYHRALSGKSDVEPLKINNTYSSRYARKLMEEDERFRSFFELRELRSA